jgi:thiol:disulfide interchange protein DsbD
MAKKKFNFIGLCSVITLGFLFVITIGFASTHHEPLTMDQGFQFSTKVKDPQTIVAEWQMAPGYFLYRQHLSITTDSPGVKLGNPIFPNGVIKNEPGFGSFEVYKDKVSIPVPVLSANGSKVNLSVRYQGCSEEGYCYPPTTKIVTLDLSKAEGSLTQPIGKSIPANSVNTTIAFPNEVVPPSEQDKAVSLLNSGHFFTIVVGFLGFGLLLAFTPCVLPMIPILSGIIVGQKNKLTTSKAFLLSLTYVLSMALTYAIAGILIGYAGGSIQAALQKPWLLILFSLFFVVLALSFFGLYELQLPSRLQSYLTNISNRQKGGNYLGVAIMGCIATLIISPCVTPALVGALGYIGKSGNAVLGGAALFALGLGMGSPLLLIGIAGGKLLPKAGHWMDTIKSIFGFILLAMAIWIVNRVLPEPLILFLWAGLLIFIASFLGVFPQKEATVGSKVTNGFAIISLVYGIILLIGATMGNSSPLQPLYTAARESALVAEQSFKHVADIKEIHRALSDAKSQNKLVMLDFYAKWCTSCNIMENRTFNNPDVMKALGSFITLKADVTENDNSAKNMQHQFSVIAPPTLLFFDNTGKELTQFRIVGEIGPKQFLDHIQGVLKAINN